MRGAIYIQTLDCYLFSCNSKLYRKDIDGKDPYIFIDDNSFCLADDFYYLEQYQSLLMIKDGRLESQLLT